MRQSIMGFSQPKIVENKLDMDDVLLLNYVYEACASPSMKKTHDDNDQPYVWLQHKKVLEDLPILGFGEETLKKRLHNLIDKELISVITKNDEIRGRRAYYTITTKCEDMRYTNQVENITLSQPVGDDQVEKNTLGDIRPSVKNYTSDNKLNNDNKLNDNFTNVKLEQPAVTPQPKRRVRLVDTPNNSVNENTVNQDKFKRKNKYQNCMDIIYEVFEDEDLRKILTVYLPVRLAMKDKPIFADGWRRLLNTLKDMSDDNVTRVKIVEQSIDNGWGKFVRLKKYNNYKRIGEQDKSVFSEYGQVKSEKRANEVIMNVQF